MSPKVLFFLSGMLLLINCHPADGRIVKGHYTINHFLYLYDEEESGKGIIQGYVRDIRTGEFLEACNVFIQTDDSKIGLMTDMNGFFKFVISEGEYVVHSKYVNMSLKTQAIQVQSDKIVEIIFYMGFTEIE